jgi:hypothetical protein
LPGVGNVKPAPVGFGVGEQLAALGIAANAKVEIGAFVAADRRHLSEVDGA